MKVLRKTRSSEGVTTFFELACSCTCSCGCVCVCSGSLPQSTLYQTAGNRENYSVQYRQARSNAPM